jgi:hypothetical protein
LQAHACFDLLAAAVFRPTKANETFGFVDVRARRGRDAREGGHVLAGPSCKITTGSGNDEQTATKRGKLTWKIHTASRAHIRASHATPRIALAKMMASVSDNIRTLTGVFTTPLQIMSDEPASLTCSPDADALGRPCRILLAIAVISDKAPPQSN